MKSASIDSLQVVNSLGYETSWSRWLSLGLSGGILVFAPLAYGAVHTWAYFSIGLVIGMQSLVLLAYGLFLVLAKPGEPRVLPSPPLWWLGAGLVLVNLLQIITWPQGMVRWLSPAAWEIRSLGNGFGLADYLPLSLNPYATLLEGLKFWPAVVLFFLLIYSINARRQIRVLVGVVLGVAFFETLYGFWQFRGHQIWGWQNQYTDYRLCGTFINSNHLALLLTMAILLGFGLLLSQREVKSAKLTGASGWDRLKRQFRTEYLEPQFRRFLLLFFLLLLTVGLIFTASRGGMIALVAGLALMGLLIRSRGGKRGTSILIVVFLSSALIASLLLGSGQILERIQGVTDQNRNAAYRGALKIFAEFPLLGSGLATFGDVFYRYEPAKLKGLYFIHSHSDWLQLLAETGILGFSLVAVAWLVFFAKLVRQWRRRQDRFAQGLGLGALAALGTGAFHALFEFPFHIPAISLLYASIAAITYLTLYSQIRRDGEYFSYPVSVFQPRPKLLVGLLSGLMILQLAFLTQISYNWCSEGTAPTEINSTRPTLKLQADDFRQALVLNPKNSKYYLGLAETLEKGRGEGAPAQIEQALQSAIFFSPANWGYRLQLAEFCLRQHQSAPDRYIPRALNEVDATVKLFPESAPLHFYLASLLIWAADKYPGLVPSKLQDQSELHFEKARKLDPKMTQQAPGLSRLSLANSN